MAALEASFSIFSTHPSLSPAKSSLCTKSSPSVKLHFPSSTPTTSLKFPVCPLPHLPIHPTRKPSQICPSAVQEIAVEEQTEQTQELNQKRKLYVLNLPWSFTVADLKSLFGECGTVTDVEVIKQKGGKSRGFAFVTMASGEEAKAVITKFDSHELLGRIIRVEFAKRFKRPSPPPPPEAPPPGETRHLLYVSNLAWKVRSSHLREFFAANVNPVSARVVFDSPSGRSAGYGFVSFATKEEAESAISALDKKVMNLRKVSLAFHNYKYLPYSILLDDELSDGVQCMDYELHGYC
ncbi:hypothetical protein RJ640_017828 [Escallonia rubra]|uniref:RRM domain-containing protein n=1 Tax=Escallonia rubra TaxID=112253 RepID=A0AA88S146_9ASTE|nr:hypothetical protein RJ640_017828 [Escallonia rubra]